MQSHGSPPNHAAPGKPFDRQETMPLPKTPIRREHGSVILNASTVIPSGLEGGQMPSGHRAGTPPGYRANSVVRATISSLCRVNGSIRYCVLPAA